MNMLLPFETKVISRNLRFLTSCPRIVRFILPSTQRSCPGCRCKVRIALSQRERDRLRVLHEITQKQITQREAASRLKISDRHIRRLLVELRKRGDRAVLHGLRGSLSNRSLAARLEQQILRRVRQRYADFGPTLAAEHLAQEGLLV
jgi:predicted DNA-binding protein (UPF0251 family)